MKYIKAQADLNDLIPELQYEKEIALDLEFDKNRFAYGFTLSLIQIKYSSGIILIDGMSCKDLSGIFSILENEKVQKIVFAFGEDIRLLHYLDCKPKNIFDLAYAINLLNYEPCGLSALSTNLLGIEEKASSQKSNWIKRPLTDKQLAYAAEDVMHLSDLKGILINEMSEAGVYEWFKEECRSYDHADYSVTPNFSPIKKKDLKELNEIQAFRLERLMDFRESLAESLNKPGYFLVSKDDMVALAMGKKNFSQFLNSKGLNRIFYETEIKSSLHEILTTSENEAKELGLSENKPAIERLTKEEYELMKKKKSRTDKITNSILLPIKDDLRKSHGSNTASFIFSNKIMQGIAHNGLKDVPVYKQKIIWEKAEELKLDLSLIQR